MALHLSSLNGICASYLVASGDSCSAIAASHSITVDNINYYNNETWGWMGCSDLQIGNYICLSTGNPPLPAPVANACGTTAEFCTQSDSATGAPGTTAPEQDGWIANCGTEILSYNFSINVTHIQDQFNAFIGMTGIQRIISFGGWEFSTSSATFEIFREAVQLANRANFTNNQYPGEPDTPGIPASTKEDVSNFVEFMAALKRNVTSFAPGKILSITAPASYWYLKDIPITSVAGAVDYIVYKTYDLHGQWDYGNAYSDPGCPAGNCLRSHGNLTETLNALSMITKAGIPSVHVVIGVTSYGRSFQMTTEGCYTEMCIPCFSTKKGRRSYISIFVVSWYPR
ncbi:glycoside hydrolase superfamily [Talaromyces proteolyticus]|uniref:chitinase n=1 Tax=Talaromyces proteolyticus TaxID=1131652 RepID=A0AAD4KXT2_9EURO|nr:glycoside hydrolase superfamily [Talaromyces proteolyticus]KAH8703525.1 glycoside hydrolase superfamily [Talaromyces proteolyticus]